MIHNLIILSFALACTIAPVQEIPADYELTSAAQIPEQELFESHRGGVDRPRNRRILGRGDRNCAAASVNFGRDGGCTGTPDRQGRR